VYEYEGEKMPDSTQRPTRPRNAAVTRQRILVSARAAFIAAGYESVGVREIAAGAGVTAMMVNRYFGSKEQLYTEVVAATMATPGILTGEMTVSGRDLGGLSRNIAAALLAQTSPEKAPLDGFLIMLRSTSNERSAEVWREQIEVHYQKYLTGLLSGELAAERAALILALIAGFQVMRQIIGVTALKKAQPELLAQKLKDVIQAIIGTDPFGRP
jgi:AcrR family transcriptional regulator